MQSHPAQVKAKRGKKSWLINRNYRLLFIGQGISLLGDQISSYTLLLWVVLIIARGQSWAPIAVSGLMIAGMIPNLAVGPLAGVFVDRWDHRLTMLRMDGLRALLTFFLFLCTGIIALPFLPNGQLPGLVLLVILACVAFLTSVCSQFFGPSYIGLLGQIIPEEQRGHAVGLGQTMQSFATIIGPPLAAPLLITLGVQWALLIDVLSYVASLVTLWLIQAPTSATTHAVAHGNVRKEFMEGLRFSFGNRIVRMLITVSTISAVGIGAFETLYLFFIQRNLHTDVRMAGLIGAILSIGTIFGALFAGRVCNAIGAKRMLYGSLAALGCIVIVLSRQTSFIAALVLIFLLGIVAAALRVANGPLLLKETPKTMIGRVVSVMTPLATLATLFSITLAGFCVSVLLVHLNWSVLGTTFRAIDTVFVGVGIIFLIAALYAYQASRSEEKENIHAISTETARTAASADTTFGAD